MSVVMALLTTVVVFSFLWIGELLHDTEVVVLAGVVELVVDAALFNGGDDDVTNGSAA